jgi:uncharacterized membrane protein
MVGWGFAFGRGFVVLLWSILWAIVGGVIAIVISGGTLITLASNPTAALANPLALIGTFFLGVFLAVFVSVIGLYASIVKVAVDGALKQMEASGFRQPGASYNLGNQPTLAFAPSSAVKFCKNCGSSIPSGSPKCPTCGANL